MKCFSLLFLQVIIVGLVSGYHIRSCTVDGTVALTFDDGPSDLTNELVDKLNKYGIKATFFINADNNYPKPYQSKELQAVIKKAYKSGHQIASHTWDHTLPSASNMKKELAKMDDWIYSIIGEKPRFFRAPGGNCDDKCVANIESLGYRVIKWDTDTEDWKLSSSSSISFLKKEFAKRKSSYLVLFHDTKKHSVRETVPWIISSGMLEKYKFVTVAECIGQKSKMYRSGNVVGSSSSGTTTKKTTTTTVVVATQTPVVSNNATAVTPVTNSTTLTNNTTVPTDPNMNSSLNGNNNATISNNDGLIIGSVEESTASMNIIHKFSLTVALVVILAILF